MTSPIAGHCIVVRRRAGDVLFRPNQRWFAHSPDA